MSNIGKNNYCMAYSVKATVKQVALIYNLHRASIIIHLCSVLPANTAWPLLYFITGGLDSNTKWQSREIK